MTQGVRAALALALAGILMATGGIVALGPLAGSSARPFIVNPTTGAPEWTNGAVSLAFPASNPDFTVTSIQDGRVAASVNVSGLAEVNATGQIVAYAPFSPLSVHWLFAPVYRSNATVVTVSSTVPVIASSGAWDELSVLETEDGLGNVSVNLTYQLNSSTVPSPTTVAFSINASGWPWVSQNDTLGLAIGMTAIGSTGLSLDPTGRGVIERTSGQATVARLFWDSDAIAQYPGNTTSTASVGSFQNLSVGASSVRLLFGSVTGGYRSLSYDPWLALNPDAFHSGLAAWLLTPEGLAALALGAGIVLALAVIAYRRRSEPGTEP